MRASFRRERRRGLNVAVDEGAGLESPCGCYDHRAGSWRVEQGVR